MNTDFLDACERHWADAELLFNEQRWANADHLYGISAECGLKQLMICFGMSVNPANGSPDQPDRKHANEIRPRYESYRSQRYTTDYSLSPIDHFDDWTVNQRYANQSQFNKARAQKHKAGANEVRALIQIARSEGLIA